MISLSHIVGQHASLPNFEVTLLDPHENPVDLTSASSMSFRAQLIGDPSVVMTGAVTAIDAGGGSVSYAFTSGNTQISGSYLATISVTLGGKVQQFPFNDYFLIVVEPDLVDDSDDPDVELVFATTADARAAGYEISTRELLRAQGHIEVMCGRMIEAIQVAIDEDTIGKSDKACLKKATIYQAVWLAANEDAEERADITTIRTAGLSGEAATLTADGIILAPLARRLLTRLSWVRSRSIRTSGGSGIVPASLTTTNGNFPAWKNM